MLTAGQIEIEGNARSVTFRIVGDKSINVRIELFQYFIDMRSTLKPILSKKVFLTQEQSLYKEYCKFQRDQGLEPPKISFSNRWLKGCGQAYHISMRKTNKFSISAEALKKRHTISSRKLVLLDTHSCSFRSNAIAP